MPDRILCPRCHGERTIACAPCHGGCNGLLVDRMTHLHFGVMRLPLESRPVGLVGRDRRGHRQAASPFLQHAIGQRRADLAAAAKTIVSTARLPRALTRLLALGVTIQESSRRE